MSGVNYGKPLYTVIKTLLIKKKFNDIDRGFAIFFSFATLKKQYNIC